MEVIQKPLLAKYAKSYANARKSLNRWLTITEEASWQSLVDIRAHFPATDYIPDKQYCFDIGGNNYRLVTAISFSLGTVTILDFLTHAEYNKTVINTR